MKKAILSFLLPAALFSGCGIDSPFCKGKTKNTGVIVGVFNVPACFNPDG
jgi:hypothetical protein